MRVCIQCRQPVGKWHRQGCDGEGEQVTEARDTIVTDTPVYVRPGHRSYQWSGGQWWSKPLPGQWLGHGPWIYTDWLGKKTEAEGIALLTEGGWTTEDTP
jgi:hypothetical protein